MEDVPEQRSSAPRRQKLVGAPMAVVPDHNPRAAADPGGTAEGLFRPLRETGVTDCAAIRQPPAGVAKKL